MISKFIYPTKFFFLVATLISCLALICVKSKMIASTIQLGGGGGVPSRFVEIENFTVLTDGRAMAFSRPD